MEEKINWYKYKSCYKEGYLEKSIIGTYRDKLMNIVVEFKENMLEATLKARIISIDKETGEGELEYFYKRNYVGIGREFIKKMTHEMLFKLIEIERIVKKEDNLIY